MQCDQPLRIKPPLTETTKETLAALKAQLEMELKNIKQCAYKSYECTQLTVDGYNYCLRHILQDKNAPYKQCTYVYTTNGKRCHLPAPKDKKDSTGYCNEHALKTHLITSKRGNRCQPPRTAEVLLHSVSHYMKKPRTRTLSCSTQHSDEGRSSTPEEKDDGLITKSLDPFVDIDANAVLASGSDVLDMCSESESDVDATSYGSVWHDAHGESSDNESIDSEQEDVLKHANVYSAEEVTLITRDKLIRLQSLYIDHFRYLTHILRERRRRYLYALKREKESCCSVYNQIHDSPKEQRLYKKLKAYNSYHKKHGIEAICHKRLHERRLKATEGINVKPPSYSKCIFTEGGVKCGERALPVTRHCRKHILEDPNQILFRACSKMCGDIECTTPIEGIFDDATCRLHLDIPQLRSYSQVRKDSESDYDESLEHVTSSAPGTSETSTLETSKIKSEINESLNFSTAVLNSAIAAAKGQLKKEMIEREAQDSSTSNLLTDETNINLNVNSGEELILNQFDFVRGSYSNQDEDSSCINLSGIMDVSSVIADNMNNMETSFSAEPTDKTEHSISSSLGIAALENLSDSNEISAMEVCEESHIEGAQLDMLEKPFEESIITNEVKYDSNMITEMDTESEIDAINNLKPIDPENNENL